MQSADELRFAYILLTWKQKINKYSTHNRQQQSPLKTESPVA